MENVTIKELAARAGVSGTTVSLVFQGNSRVSESTRKKVLRIARQMNYVPNLAARQLRGGKSRIKTIGLLVNNLINPFYALMVHSAEKAALRHGYEILIADTQWNSEKELTELKNMIQFRVEGVAACIWGMSKQSLDLIHRFPSPFVMMDTVPEVYSGSYVINDVPAAARLATEHLIEAGCERIVFFNSDKRTAGFSGFRLLAETFKDTLRDHNKTFDEKMICHAGLDIDAGRNAMAEIVKQVPDMDGLLCASTLCAMGAMETATRLGIKIGRDLAVVGIDDLDICALDCISLTAIRQPFEQLTQIAIDTLIGSIEERRSLDVQVSLKPELVVRNSTNRS